MFQLLKDEEFPTCILKSLSNEQPVHFMKYCLFLFAKHGETELLRDFCQLMNENLTDEEIKETLHLQTEDGIFSKSLINYCNENNDMDSCKILLKLEHKINANLKEGLHALHKQRLHGPLSQWILNTYTNLYPASKVKLWIKSSLQVLLVLGVLSYGTQVYDIYSDVMQYKEYSNFSTSVFDEGKTNCTFDDLFDVDGSHATYEAASKITLIVLILSAVIYLVNVMIADVPHILPYTWGKDALNNFVLNKLVMLLFWPFIHMFYKTKQGVTSKKTLNQDKEGKLEVLLRITKFWEVGLENNIQLIVSLWAGKHFTPCLLKKGYLEVLNEGFIGLKTILSFGTLKANFVQMLLGKLLIALLSALFSLALMKADKQGLNIAEILCRALLLFAAYLFQTISRLTGLFSLVFMNQNAFKYFIFFGLHTLLTLAIIVIFETNFRLVKKSYGKPIIYILLRALSSIFVLPSDLNKQEVSHTFVSQSLYQILCLLENLSLVLIMNYIPGLYPPEILNNMDTCYLVYIALGGWTISIVLQV